MDNCRPKRHCLAMLLDYTKTLLIVLTATVLSACDDVDRKIAEHSTMRPNPNNEIFPTEAFVVRNEMPGSYTIRWTSETPGTQALIFAVPVDNAEPAIEDLLQPNDHMIDPVAVSPFSWTADDPKVEYRFAILPLRGSLAWASAEAISTPVEPQSPHH